MLARFSAFSFLWTEAGIAVTVMRRKFFKRRWPSSNVGYVKLSVVLFVFSSGLFIDIFVSVHIYSEAVRNFSMKE